MRQKLALLIASLFLVMGSAWAQVSEGRAYFLKVVGVENAYIDAKTNKGGNKGGTIGISSVKVPVYFQKDGDNWKISIDETLNGGFLKVNAWDVNPQQSTGTSWTIEDAGDGNYRLKQGDFTTSDGPYLGCTSLSATANLYSNRPVAEAVKVQFVEPYKIELTTDVNNPKWYTIKNVRESVYARYDGDGEAIKLYSNIVDRAFLFYFTAGDAEGTYKIHNAANNLLCAAPNSWTETGIDWYIKASGNASHPGFAIAKQNDLTDKGSEAWNDYQNNATSVNWYGGNDAGSTWDIERYEGEAPAIQLSTEGNIVLHYIRSIRRDSYVNFAGHEVKFDEGAQGLMSYWYFVEDTEAPAIDGYIACKIFNAAHATGVEDHGKGFMGTSDWPAKTYYIGFKENDRYGYTIRRIDLANNGWHDYSGDYVGDYGLGDNGSLWRIYPAGKKGADLINEATTAKNNALSTIASYENADYYTYSDEAIATAKSAIEAVNTNELHTAVAGITSIPAAMETLQAAEKSSSAPAVGDYLRFKNKAKGVYMAATVNDDDMIRKSNDKTDLKTLWLVEAGADGSVKLKNVATQKYIGAIAQSKDVKQKESAEASQLTFENVADVYGTFQTTGGDTYSYANLNEWYGAFKVVGWEKGDNASQWLIEQAYPLTVIYQSEGVELTEFRVEQAVEPGTVYTIENSDAFGGKIIKSVEGATDNGAGAWTVTVNAATTVTVTLGVEDTDLYALKSPTGTYFNFTAVVPEPGAATTYASFQDEPSFVYKKSDVTGIYFQSLEDESKYIGYQTTGAYWITTTSQSYWTISEVDGLVELTRIQNVKGEDTVVRLGHDGNTNVGTGIFTNVGGDCNKWQLIPAYPITIIYKNNSSDEEIEIVKTAAIAGTEFSYDIDTKSYDFVSCETDKGSIEVEDGTCTIAAVNGATTITISLAPVKEVVNPDAVVALVNRIGGIGTSNSFKFVHDRSLEGETFVIGAEDGKILIKGSTISAITTGIGWYLNNIAHINIAWNSLNEKTTTVKWDPNAGYADLSHLPIPTTEETHTSDAKYRYYLNYCTFGYSMTSWTWTRWQQEIDWMALHGINMPLQIVGLEEVWRKFLSLPKYNYTAEEAKAFVPGPAYTAWWGMNNLQGWGGTGAGDKIKTAYDGTICEGTGGVQDDAWYVRQEKLAKQILDAQRALGMQPVLPGFSGMVPSNFTTKTGIATDQNNVQWQSFLRPSILDPTAQQFADVAKDYYTCLKEVMGESQYYSMDPFHEGGSIASGKYSEAYTAIYEAMETANAGSQWVIQQWHWTGNQAKSVNAVPAGRLIVLDLFSDGDPDFDDYGGNAYSPQHAVFCAIPNFGGRSGLMGRLQNVTDNYFKYKAQYATIKGIGAAPEAIEQTPVTYDLIYQLPWMNGVKPNVEEWVNNYAVARYGVDNAVTKEAWSLLRRGPLNYGADAIEGPVEDVWGARPNLNSNAASYWGKTLNTAGTTYTKERRQMLIDAVYKLLSQKDAIGTSDVFQSNYNYDLVEFGGGVMADYAYDLLLGIKAAKEAAGNDFENDPTYKARRDAFLSLIADVDAFKGTNLNFRLGKWTQEARDAAAEVQNATSATPDWYEFNNARTLISTWTYKQHGLNDYSYRSWQGLLKDYYLPRWQYYFDHGCTNPHSGYFYFEWNWAHGMTHQVGDSQKSETRLSEGATGYSYTREPEGNTVEKAVEMLGKYIIPVPMADGTHYAYRYLTNDLSNKVTIIAAAGSTIDLTQYFGALEGATVTGDFIEGQATDFTNIPLKANLDGAYTGTITLADGTVLTFGVSVNPKYNGTYKIKYSGDPVFIQYHNVGDNAGNVGYKVVTTKKGNGGSTGYSADYEADQLFTITPSGTGFALSAQGQYLKTTVSSGWNHIMFSEQKGDAGTYLINEANDVVTLKSTNTSGMPYVAIYDNGAWGNDVEAKVISFTLEPVTTYAITIPESGYYGICLPFNVVLPTGVTAYDVTVENLTCGDDGAITSLASIATEGQILKAGTPALLKGTAGNYALAITMDNTNAKTSSVDSKLRGNFVKQTLAPGILNKFIYTSEGEHPFVRINDEQEIPANTCWIEANIEANNVEVTEHQGKVIKVDDWLFSYEVSDNGSITLINAVQSGSNKDLVIGSHYTINGKTQRVSAISPTFLHGNTDLTSITLPATMTNLGFRIIQPMFKGSYEGQAGDGGKYSGSTAQGEVVGKDREFVFPKNDETGEQYQVNGNFAWRLTLDVSIDTTKSTSFNNYGSAIVSSQPNSLADYYNNFMQIYLWQDLQHIVVKIDNNDDRYSYSLPELDAEGRETGKLVTLNHFKFELEHDGAGGYQVVIYYDDGRAKMYSISAGQSNLNPFSSLWYSLPEGIHVDVTFEELISQGLFVGCTNLQKIIVDPANPTFKSCEHGVLYDKNGYYVMRIPEGDPGTLVNGRKHFDIPSKVVKLYAGAVHGVNADIVLHSNPQIGVVKGHEHDVENAKFYLSLDDIDPDTLVGGARDFISTNNNTYLAARYKRAPLAEGKMGTICLPFAIAEDNAIMQKYDFYKLKGGNASSLTFTQVTELVANEPYLYRWKQNPVEPTELAEGGVFDNEEIGTLDVFETDEEFTVQTKDKYDPNSHKSGTREALGAFVNYYLDADKNTTGSSFYIYQSSTNKFHRVTKRLTYRPYRAFFVVTPEAGQQAQAPSRLNLELLDGTTTSIDASLVEGMEAPEYYDLSGRRVLNPVSGGIYIVNGQKVVLK